MSGGIDTNQTDVKRIKTTENYKKYISLNLNRENFDVAFQNLCLKYSIENLDDKSFDAYKNFNNTGKINNITF